MALLQTPSSQFEDADKNAARITPRSVVFGLAIAAIVIYVSDRGKMLTAKKPSKNSDRP